MYSDHPPYFVAPDTEAGRKKVQDFALERGLFYFCSNFADVSPYWLQPDKTLPVETPCANRRMGDEQHNWCLRCISGYPITTY